MAVNPRIDAIIAAGYNRMAELGLEIIQNYDNGFGQSEQQKESWQRLVKGTKILRLISKFVEFDDDGNYVQVHRLSDTQINDLLKDLTKILRIKGLPVAPKIFYRGYPYVRVQGSPGNPGGIGSQGPPGGGTGFSSLNFSAASNVVDRFAITEAISAEWRYELWGSLGRRSGVIRATWSDDGLTISEPSEVGTDDIGVSIGNIAFTVEKDGTDIVLKASRVSGTWSVRGLRYFASNNASLPATGALANGKIYVGNPSDIATAVTPGGVVAMTNGGVFSFVAGSIVNADINAGAAIAYSKLNLSASVVNADIAVGAAIAYSKLNLTGAIVNADIGVAAAIARTKIASGTANRLVINNGSGVMVDHAAITANMAIVSNASGLPEAHATTTATQIGYLNDVTSPIQAQISAITTSIPIYVNIVDWDMDTDAFKIVAHGIADTSKIRSVTGVIFDDAGTGIYTIGTSHPATAVDDNGVCFAPGYGTGGPSIGVTNITLARATGGAFDNTNFNQTGGYIRGRITIFLAP